jgi:ELWxxDGT repeat protein
LFVKLLVMAGTVVLLQACGGGGGDGETSPATPAQLWLSADNGATGIELFRSDGTAAGTSLIKDINTGIASSNPSNLVVIGGAGYFTANDGTNGIELWRSDRTEAVTAMVMDINPNAGIGSSPASLTAVGDTLYFTANDGTNGSELWKSDSTGTAMVYDIAQGTGSSYPDLFTAVGSTLYFTANDGINGVELWKSDSAGTVMAQNINPNPGSGFTGSGYPASLTAVSNTLYFTANDGTHGYELWKSDSAGTVMVKDINQAGNSYPLSLFAVGSTLYFVAADGTNGNELWKSNGTAENTVIIIDLYPGPSTGVRAILTSPVQDLPT